MGNAKEKSDKMIQFPETGTSSLAKYHAEAASTLQIYYFIANSASLADGFPRMLEQLIEEDTPVDELPSPSDIAQNSPGPHILQLRRYSNKLSQLMLSRLVDNFQCYISDILRECFTTDKRVLLSSNPSLSLEYVFGFSDIDDLFHDVIDAKVNSLSYKGFGELYKWCQSRGIPIQLEDELFTKISNLIAIRNLVAHNRGVVDKRFMENTDIEGLEIGEPFKIKIGEFTEASVTLGEAAVEIDNSSKNKFGLNEIKLELVSNDT